MNEESAPVLFNFDEAGNIFIHGLNELLGVGRGRLMSIALGFQNIGQVYHHYGADGGDAVLGSIGTMVFLPGLDQRTTEYASKRIGQATVWQATSVDVKEGAKFDSERTTEVGRSLLDAAEVRRMVKHQQAIAIIGNAPPVRFSYPPQARIPNAPLSQREKNWIKPPPTAQKVEAVVESKIADTPAPIIVADIASMRGITTDMGKSRSPVSDSDTGSTDNAAKSSGTSGSACISLGRVFIESLARIELLFACRESTTNETIP